eukprot:gene2397-1962_t
MVEEATNNLPPAESAAGAGAACGECAEAAGRGGRVTVRAGLAAATGGWV